MVRVWLRRWRTFVDCPVHGDHHEAWALLGDEHEPISEQRYIEARYVEHTDSRWPRVCACGYVFDPEADAWQVYPEQLWEAPDGQRYTLRPPTDLAGAAPAPPGAMWDCWWFIDADDPWRGPDGRSLMVRLPSGEDWLIDGPSATGGRWSRHGEPPRLTVVPSIRSQRYHGFLTDGVFTEDMDRGRR